MNDRKHQVSTAQLNKVPGFDPPKFLNYAATGEAKAGVPRMDLRYKRLWFRLAYPNGRMRLITKHITEQMAIFEAQIFLDRSDNEPVGNFTATCTAEQSANYIETAQEAALDAALSNAGFGVQFGNGARVPIQHVNTPQRTVAASEPPRPQAVPETGKTPASVAQKQNTQTDASANVSQTTPQPALKIVPPIVKEAEQQKADETSKSSESRLKVQKLAAPQQITLAPDMLNTVQVGGEELDSLPVAPVIKKSEEAVQAESLPVTNYAQSSKTAGSVTATAKPNISEPNNKSTGNQTPDIPLVGNQTSNIPVSSTLVPDNPIVNIHIPTTGSIAKETPQAQEVELPIASVSTGSGAQQIKYTEDTPVEEILKVMTFEEAQNVVVNIGTCKGWTMAQVAERRPPSLKWYVFGCKDGSNILRAAAQIMMESLTETKAG